VLPLLPAAVKGLFLYVPCWTLIILDVFDIREPWASGGMRTCLVASSDEMKRLRRGNLLRPVRDCPEAWVWDGRSSVMCFTCTVLGLSYVRPSCVVARADYCPCSLVVTVNCASDGVQESFSPAITTMSRLQQRRRFRNQDAPDWAADCPTTLRRTFNRTKADEEHWGDQS